MRLKRIGFVHVQPQAVVTMCLSKDRSVLAVARRSGQIEIWLVDVFEQLLVLPGNLDLEIRTILWVEPENNAVVPENPLYLATERKEKKRRLVTVSLSGHVIEWDLVHRSMQHVYQSPGGPIFSAVANHKNLFLACADGSVHVVRLKKRGFEP